MKKVSDEVILAVISAVTTIVIAVIKSRCNENQNG